jgi:hypothetical protein
MNKFRIPEKLDSFLTLSKPFVMMPQISASPENPIPGSWNPGWLFQEAGNQNAG